MLARFRSKESYDSSAEFTREYYRQQGERRRTEQLLALMRAEQVRTSDHVYDACGVLTKLIARIEELDNDR